MGYYIRNEYNKHGRKVPFIEFDEYQHTTKRNLSIATYGVLATCYVSSFMCEVLLKAYFGFVVGLASLAPIFAVFAIIIFGATCFFALHGLVYPYKMIKAAIARENERHEKNMAASKNLQDAIDRLNLDMK